MLLLPLGIGASTLTSRSQYPVQRRGQRHRIVTLGGSVVSDPMKVRVPAQIGRTAVQPLRYRHGVDVGQNRVHGEAFWGMIGEHVQMLLR